MNKNIIGIFEQANKHEYNSGLNWFGNAREIASNMAKDYNISLEKVAAIISILSPANNWQRNIIDADNVLNGWANGKTHEIVVTTYGRNKAKALKVLEDTNSNFTFPISSRYFKTLCFWDNIVDPNSDRVTVDRHAAKVYWGAKYAGAIDVRGKKYTMIEGSYIKTAKHLGMLPHQLQAITWLTYKRLMNR